MAAERFTIGRADAIGTEEQVPIADVRFGFREGYVIEIVRVVEGYAWIETLDVFVFPIAPMKYEQGEPFAAALTPTMGNTVIPEESGVLMRDLVIEGTFGLKKRRASGFEGAQGNGQPLSGNEHFIRLRQLFRAYGLLKQNPTEGYKIQMRWHALREDDHFIVIPRKFSTPRDAKTTRLHYQYRIEMTAIGVVDSVNAPTVSDDTGNFFDDASRAIMTGLGDATAAFQDLTSNLSTLQRKLGNIQAIMINVGGFINSVGNSLRAGSRIIDYPFQLATSIADTIAQASDDLADASGDIVGDVATIDATAARSFRQMEQAFNRILAFGDRFVSVANDRIAKAYEGERRLTSRDLDDGTAGAQPGSRTRSAYGTEANAGIPLEEPRSVRAVSVTATTTLPRLSAAFGVSPEAIAILNDLRPPYFAPGGGPGLLGPGDTVLIPSFDSSDENVSLGASVTDYATADELLYGRDLAIDMDHFKRTGRFELMEDLVHGGTDAVVIGGVPNVVQGTLITVETERGATVYLPDIGVRRTPGTKGTLANVLLAALTLREAILADPRIERIDESRVVLEDDVLVQEVTPRLIGGRSDVTLVRPFGRASGGS